MNTLLTGLDGVCTRYPFDEKILLAPSYSTGHQLIEALVREGHACINLRCETTTGLARRLLEHQIIEGGLKPLTDSEATGFIEEACRDLLVETSYFGKLRETAGLHAALLQTIAEVRLAGMTASDIPIEAFEIPAKGEEFVAIQESFEQSLEQRRLLDQAGLLRLALESPAALKSPAVRHAWYLYPENLRLSNLEKRVLQELGNDRLVGLGEDKLSDWAGSRTDIRIFRASGEENEVREVFGRVLRERIPLDQVEILFTQPDTYLPLLHELASETGLLVTFAQGIPVCFTRPGQALLDYLEWFRTDFDSLVLRRSFLGGFFDLRGFGDQGHIPGPFKCGRILTEAAIAWGRERYLPCLNELISVYSQRLDALKLQEEQAEGDEPGDVEWLQRQLDYTRTLQKFMGRLLELTPESDGEGLICWLHLISAARGVLAEMASVGSEYDGKARASPAKLLTETELPGEAQLPANLAAERLDRAIRSARAGAQNPQPGQIHAASLFHGGWAGRPHTFILGLDEARHPGAGLPDPVLLDDERRRISASVGIDLPVSHDRLEERNRLFFSALARCRGAVTLSYSSRDLLEEREQFPSPALLDVFRRTSGSESAGYQALVESVGRPSGFVSETREPLEETEYWLGETAGKRAASVLAPTLRRAYPWLAEGLLAGEARQAERYTRFDGLVQTDGQLDPRAGPKPVSATRIELLATCPFSYFLREILRVVPPDLRLRDPMTWLQAIEFGQLLHEVLHDVMLAITQAGETPAFARHWEALESETERHLVAFRRRFPPPNEAAFELQRADLRDACRIFLKNEERHCRKSSPLYFEVEFGLPPTDVSAPISSPEPVVIDLGNGRSFCLRGRIDRIDGLGSGQFAVWDYKSGSTWSIKEESLFNGGRQLQHALYACAAESLLQRAGQEGRVVESGYFFPSAKGEGLRIVKTRNLEGMRVVLNNLFDLLRDGVFVSALNDDKCEYCDYVPICGGKDVAVPASKWKLVSDDNPVLTPLRNLNDVS